MKNFLKVMVFSLVTILAFAGYSNYGIPKIEPAPPPKEEKLDLGSMTMESFIVLGEKIYKGKGTCTLCHNELGRAPMLEQVVSATPKRLEDSRYKGKSTDVESYLTESMVDPSAYVVAGFGKAGTNDTESPMPDVTSGGIGMSDAEIKSVIAYLQDLGGTDVTVEIPKDVGKTAAKEDVAAAAGGAKRLAYKTAQEAMAGLGCIACHKVAGAGGEVGPDISHIGADKDREYLRRSILQPSVDVAEGYPPIMPATFGEQLYANELEMLLDYLAGLK
jgi:mono/diheme cytochrome c family protein